MARAEVRRVSRARKVSAEGAGSERRASHEDAGDRVRRVADAITTAVGTPQAMAIAALIVVAWAVTGPIFSFSDTWQLVINTGTTIVTFLMVFAIQTSQNREARATQLKLDELIRATKGARNDLIDEEHRTEAELKAAESDFKRAS